MPALALEHARLKRTLDERDRSVKEVCELPRRVHRTCRGRCRWAHKGRVPRDRNAQEVGAGGRCRAERGEKRTAGAVWPRRGGDSINSGGGAGVELHGLSLLPQRVRGRTLDELDLARWPHRLDGERPAVREYHGGRHLGASDPPRAGVSLARLPLRWVSEARRCGVGRGVRGVAAYGGGGAEEGGRRGSGGGRWPRGPLCTECGGGCGVGEGAGGGSGSSTGGGGGARGRRGVGRQPEQH